MPPAVLECFRLTGLCAVVSRKVVDMLYFPLFSFYWPDWVPFIGGQFFLFFQPIFNIADAAITVGILVLILFLLKGPVHSRG